MSQNRRPAGTPAGGQYSASAHAEAHDVHLDAPPGQVDPNAGIFALRDQVEAWCHASGHGADVDDLTYYVARTGADDLAIAYDAYARAYTAATWTFTPPATSVDTAGPGDAARTG